MLMLGVNSPMLHAHYLGCRLIPTYCYSVFVYAERYVNTRDVQQTCSEKKDFLRSHAILRG